MVIRRALFDALGERLKWMVIELSPKTSDFSLRIALSSAAVVLGLLGNLPTEREREREREREGESTALMQRNA